jgi:hypothetical protein
MLAVVVVGTITLALLVLVAMAVVAQVVEATAQGLLVQQTLVAVVVEQEPTKTVVLAVRELL